MQTEASRVEAAALFRLRLEADKAAVIRFAINDVVLTAIMTYHQRITVMVLLIDEPNTEVCILTGEHGGRVTAPEFQPGDVAPCR